MTARTTLAFLATALTVGFYAYAMLAEVLP